MSRRTKGKGQRPAAPGTANPFWRAEWFLALALIICPLLAYQPAWQGKPIWDDDAHITRQELRSLDGLARIWTQPGATQQYYPVVYSAFWLEYRLWDDWAPAYHLVNILLHASSALLLAKILKRLAIPGAWLAAAVFALHPVEVESVAWIAELKNTLSGLFYLGAFLFYLDFDQRRKGVSYFLALGLFLLGLGTKTVIATLPAALLVVFWWQRGRLFWKRDALPLLPFFASGIGAGLLTAWMEHHFVGAHGFEFDFTVADRCLIAGRAFWFYLFKILWPANLTFIYPRWEISHEVWWQYLFPAAALLLLVLLWRRRKSYRAPLAALLYFAGTLFPVLGFLNVYPFRYSFVADHFQYLASIGPITLIAAGLIRGWHVRARPALGIIPGSALLLMLGVLTWRQSATYADLETIWGTTLARNPGSWLAHNNFGNMLLEKGEADEAFLHFERALEINPNSPEAHNNLGNSLRQLGRLDESLRHLEKAVELDPSYAEGHNNLGTTFSRLRKRDLAIAHYLRALELDPRYAEAHNNLANALLETGRTNEALAHFKSALEINPAYAVAHYNLANLLVQTGRLEEAVAHFTKALALKATYAAAHTNLGAVLLTMGRVDESLLHLQKAVELSPESADAHNNLGNTLLRLGRNEEALSHLHKALAIDPNNVSVLNNIAWILATSSQAALRDGPKAVELAERADRLTQTSNPVIGATLAAAYAESGRFPEATKTARHALDLASSNQQAALAAGIRAQIALYDSGLPTREER